MVVTDWTPGSSTAVVVLAGLVLLEPVPDAADEGRDEGNLCFGGGDGLVEAEEEGHVAVDALFFEDLGGLDAFPCGGKLDEDALAGDAGGLVLGDDVARGGDGFVGVVGEAGVDFGGDAARDDFKDLLAEGDGEFFEGECGDVMVGGFGAGGVAGLLEDAVDDGSVLGHTGGGGDEGGIGGGILGLVLLDRVDVAGVGDYGGHGAKLIE